MTNDDRIQVSVRLPRTLVQRIDEEARRRVLGRHRFLQLLVEAHLPDYENDPLHRPAD
jgi:metal-responsive CopG/Arc/MetJ family transcriptional regulator